VIEHVFIWISEEAPIVDLSILADLYVSTGVPCAASNLSPSIRDATCWIMTSLCRAGWDIPEEAMTGRIRRSLCATG
jgi:hypothetical protein